MLHFIGTIHCGYTNNDELVEIIENINPELILVEISQEDININSIENYPKEMKYILNWSKKVQIQCFGFDSSLDILHKNYSKENEEKLMEYEMKEIKKRNWKEFNTSKINALIDEIDLFEVVDSLKEKKREEEMKENILKIINLEEYKNKLTVIITGCGHLDFFKKEFPDAKFPLSNDNI